MSWPLSAALLIGCAIGTTAVDRVRAEQDAETAARADGALRPQR